jgi:hypothetical protein
MGCLKAAPGFHAFGISRKRRFGLAELELRCAQNKGNKNPLHAKLARRISPIDCTAIPAYGTRRIGTAKLSGPRFERCEEAVADFSG